MSSPPSRLGFLFQDRLAAFTPCLAGLAEVLQEERVEALEPDARQFADDFVQLGLEGGLVISLVLAADAAEELVQVEQNLKLLNNSRLLLKFVS